MGMHMPVHIPDALIFSEIVSAQRGTSEESERVPSGSFYIIREDLPCPTLIAALERLASPPLRGMPNVHGAWELIIEKGVKRQKTACKRSYA